MKRPQLKAEARTVLGKKVHKLRKEGLLPCNVYGKGLNSHSLQITLSDFVAVYKEAGETGLVDLEYDGKKKPVLIKNIQMNHATRMLLHIDFYQVNLKEKIKTLVPIVLIGEAKAVTDKVGMLLQNLSDVEIEALPDHLPEHIEGNVEHLAAVGEQITVADLTVPEGVEIITEGTQTVAKVGELTVAEEPTAEEAAIEETGATETKEGEEKSSEEKKEE
jgi:large subunit ribosomal protein L25